MQDRLQSQSNLIEEEIDDLVNNGIRQIILTGAPGTGKTYSVREYVKKATGGDESRYKFVQFHPSYDYSDFVEGLRPVNLKGSQDPTFVRVDGTFKNFCRTIVENNLKNAYSNGKDEDNLENAYRRLTKQKGNIVPQNAGDTEEISHLEQKNGLFTTTEKEQEYAEYFDEGINKEDKKEILYYFIIDEINRADLSKVFGELMFGLEKSYRGIANRFETQYMNLKTHEIGSNGIAHKLGFDCFEKGFFIPKNLVIIGTMNDIDRSVEAFDFALRRRFRWVSVFAKDVMHGALMGMFSEMPQPQQKKALNNLKTLEERVEKLNNLISGEKGKKLGLSKDYHIGHAYLEDFDGSNYKDIWNSRIKPLIDEYTRGRGKTDDFIEECSEAFCFEK